MVFFNVPYSSFAPSKALTYFLASAKIHKFRFCFLSRIYINCSSQHGKQFHIQIRLSPELAWWFEPAIIQLDSRERSAMNLLLNQFQVLFKGEINTWCSMTVTATVIVSRYMAQARIRLKIPPMMVRMPIMRLILLLIERSRRRFRPKCHEQD